MKISMPPPVIDETLVIKRIGLFMAIMGTALLALSLLYNMREVYLNTHALAYEGLRISLEKDILYRRWTSGHGGVYVPATKQTPPNPFLSHIPERTIQTPSGKRLTLINPAYMTRQVNEMAKKQHGSLGHLTSLKPLRLQNAPDPWEREALKSFETGIKEVKAVVNLNGVPFMRTMRAFKTEKGCLKCHARQGYRVGDIRGGISVSLPFKPFLELMHSRWITLGVGHAVLLLLGLGAVWFTFTMLGNSARQRLEALEKIQTVEKNFQTIIFSSPVGILVLNEEEQVILANEAVERMFKVDFSKSEGKRYSDFIGCVHYFDQEKEGGHSTSCDACSLKNTIREVFLNGTGAKGSEIMTVMDSGSTNRNIWVQFSIEPVVLNGSPFVVVSMDDITDRKRSEESLEESEKKFRAIFDYTHDGIFLVNPKIKKIITSNAACLEMMGYTQEEFLNLDIPDMHPDEEVPVIVELIKKTSKGDEGIRSDIRFKRKDGSIFFTDLIAVVAIISGKNHLIITFRDITRRLEMNLELQEKHDELKRWKDLTLGRENRNIELKHEVNELLTRLGESVRYGTVEEEK